MTTSDIYNRFLSGEGKVKVFSTIKKSKPVELSKRVLRRAYPFLLGSAFIVFGSSFKSVEHNETNSNNNKSIDMITYKADSLCAEITNRYKISNLKYKEVISEELIAEILNSKNLPKLNDFNYNHSPQNVDNFWNIVRNGADICMNEVQNSIKLSNNQKLQYKIMANKMLSQISVAKGTKLDVDLLDYKNLKSFLFFEKVIKYKDNFNRVIKQRKGYIDEKTEIFGRYYEDYQIFYNLAKDNADIVKFSEILYFNSVKDVMLDKDNKSYYNQKSLEILEEWKEKQKIKDENMFNLSSYEDDVYCNSVAFYYKRGKDLFISLNVDKEGDLGNGLYSPVGEIVIHELMHVMQRQPSSAEEPKDNMLVIKDVSKSFEEYKDYIDEIGPTLMTITVNDYLYKKANNINQNSVVNYGTMNVNGREIGIGELALWFRSKLEQEKNRSNDPLSVDKMLSNPVVYNELKSISKGIMPQNNLFFIDKTR